LSESVLEPARHRIYELPPALDLNAAGPLSEALQKHIGDDLVLDGSKVQRLGASCLQVLLAAARTWSVEGSAISLDNPTPRLVEDLRLLGFDALNLFDGATPQ
jgi:chemotaxis protein CheX